MSPCRSFLRHALRQICVTHTYTCVCIYIYTFISTRVEELKSTGLYSIFSTLQQRQDLQELAGRKRNKEVWILGARPYSSPLMIHSCSVVKPPLPNFQEISKFPAPSSRTHFRTRSTQESALERALESRTCSGTRSKTQGLETPSFALGKNSQQTSHETHKTPCKSPHQGCPSTQRDIRSLMPVNLRMNPSQ